MSLPPELPALCRKLGSTPAEDLPRLCPTLVSHVLRCSGPLSTPPENKKRAKPSDPSTFVHKLRTHINTLLNGRSAPGRLAAICLIKAVIDVGGWECVRTSETWVRGLISLLQKSDPVASRQLAVITLTRIYLLLRNYQTLVREIATPTLPTFLTACLRLIKSATCGKPVKVPYSLMETVASASATLIPLYPTTLRPFSGQLRAVFRLYVAPTSDKSCIPESLKRSARQLFVLLPHTAPRDGYGEEWASGFSAAIRDCQATADQIFRAVQESWETSSGYHSQIVPLDGEPSGGTDLTEGLPPWRGLQSGVERLVGLLELLLEYFQHATKTPVAIPLGELLDLADRITLVTRPTAGSEDSESTKPAIGREEKAELWSGLATIHIAVMQLHLIILRRLQRDALPLTANIMDQLVRVFNSGRDNELIREAGYSLARELLVMTGQSLSKVTVDSLASITSLSCRDLLRVAGYVEEDGPQVTGLGGLSGTKPNVHTSNADAFLPSEAKAASRFYTPSCTRVQAAEALLVALISHLPQKHITPDLRGLLDRTAILYGSKSAMLASCLHPYKDGGGRYYPSILPFLVQQFPHDEDVEVLKTIMRAPTRSTSETWESLVGLDQLLDLPAEERLQTVSIADMLPDVRHQEEAEKEAEKAVRSPWGTENKGNTPSSFPGLRTPAVEPEDEIQDASPFEQRALTPLKRKADVTESERPRKLEKAKVQDVVALSEPPSQSKRTEDDNGNDSESDRSIQIDMTFDNESEEEE